MIVDIAVIMDLGRTDQYGCQSVDRRVFGGGHPYFLEALDMALILGLLARRFGRGGSIWQGGQAAVMRARGSVSEKT